MSKKVKPKQELEMKRKVNTDFRVVGNFSPFFCRARDDTRMYFLSHQGSQLSQGFCLCYIIQSYLESCSYAFFEVYESSS